jgi:hypothetical protein
MNRSGSSGQYQLPCFVKIDIDRRTGHFFDGSGLTILYYQSIGTGTFRKSQLFNNKSGRKIIIIPGGPVIAQFHLNSITSLEQLHLA